MKLNYFGLFWIRIMSRKANYGYDYDDYDDDDYEDYEYDDEEDGAVVQEQHGKFCSHAFLVSSFGE